MRLPCFELRWLLNGMNMPWHSVFLFLFFLFRNNVNKRVIGWKRLPSLYFFAWKYHSGSYDTPLWSQLCSKFFINNHESTWQQHLKDTLQLNILWTSVSSLHQDIELIIVCFSFSQTSLVFEFILMFDFCHNLFTFLPFDIVSCSLSRTSTLFSQEPVNFHEPQCCFFVKVYNYKLLQLTLVFANMVFSEFLNISNKKSRSL